jgi:hypothetical protein
MCAPPATRKTACRGIPVHSIPQASISQRVENVVCGCECDGVGLANTTEGNIGHVWMGC